jgi:hypothetical protein
MRIDYQYAENQNDRPANRIGNNPENDGDGARLLPQRRSGGGALREKAAASSFAVEVILAPVHDTSELESVIAAQAREPDSGLFVMPDAFTITYRVEVTSLAARHRLPAVYGLRFFTELGSPTGRT